MADSIKNRRNVRWADYTDSDDDYSSEEVATQQYEALLLKQYRNGITQQQQQDQQEQEKQEKQNQVIYLEDQTLQNLQENSGLEIVEEGIILEQQELDKQELEEYELIQQEELDNQIIDHQQESDDRESDIEKIDQDVNIQKLDKKSDLVIPPRIDQNYFDVVLPNDENCINFIKRPPGLINDVLFTVQLSPKNSHRLKCILRRKRITEEARKEKKKNKKLKNKLKNQNVIQPEDQTQKMNEGMMNVVNIKDMNDGVGDAYQISNIKVEEVGEMRKNIEKKANARRVQVKKISRNHSERQKLSIKSMNFDQGMMQQKNLKQMMMMNLRNTDSSQNLRRSRLDNISNKDQKSLSKSMTNMNIIKARGQTTTGRFNNSDLEGQLNHSIQLSMPNKITAINDMKDQSMNKIRKFDIMPYTKDKKKAMDDITPREMNKRDRIENNDERKIEGMKNKMNNKRNNKKEHQAVDQNLKSRPKTKPELKNQSIIQAESKSLPQVNDIKKTEKQVKNPNREVFKKDQVNKNTQQQEPNINGSMIEMPRNHSKGDNFVKRENKGSEGVLGVQQNQNNEAKQTNRKSHNIKEDHLTKDQKDPKNLENCNLIDSKNTNTKLQEDEKQKNKKKRRKPKKNDNLNKIDSLKIQDQIKIELKIPVEDAPDHSNNACITENADLRIVQKEPEIQDNEATVTNNNIGINGINEPSMAQDNGQNIIRPDNINLVEYIAQDNAKVIESNLKGISIKNSEEGEIEKDEEELTLTIKDNEKVDDRSNLENMILSSTLTPSSSQNHLIDNLTQHDIVSIDSKDNNTNNNMIKLTRSNYVIAQFNDMNLFLNKTSSNDFQLEENWSIARGRTKNRNEIMEESGITNNNLNKALDAKKKSQYDKKTNMFSILNKMKA